MTAKPSRLAGLAPAASPPALALLLAAAEAARLCGVSTRQWWRWDSAGKVPASIRIGLTKRWRAEELRSWISSGCPPRAEWEAEKKTRVPP